MDAYKTTEFGLAWFPVTQRTKSHPPCEYIVHVKDKAQAAK